MLRWTDRWHKAVFGLLFVTAVATVAFQRITTDDRLGLTISGIGCIFVAGVLLLALMLTPSPPVVHSDE